MAGAWTALVTGASRGIGAAVVDAFLQAGATVAAAAPAGEQPKVRREDEAAFDLTMYVRDPASVSGAVADAEERLGRIDVLVNAAGIIERIPFLRLTEERWHDVVETNLSGTFRVSQSVAAGMVRRGSGRIINIASNNALGGSPGHQAYDASKAGVVGPTRSMAVELGSVDIHLRAKKAPTR